MGYLDPILASTRARIAELRGSVTPDVLEQRIASLEPPRGFSDSLRARDGLALIAEIKRVSPARGALDVDLNASELAVAYAAGGAAAVSVVTEPDHFKGSIEDLHAARSSGLPLLRKDFVLDELQVLESRAAGADAVLLIVRVLDKSLATLIAAARALLMEPLVEVHDEQDLERALEAGADVIGVNHRDLDTFEVDPERTSKLAPLLPQSCLLVALSGVSSSSDVRALKAAGAAAVVVGEALITAPDPATKLRELASA